METDGQSTLKEQFKQHARGANTDKKQQSSGDKKNYSKQDIEEQLEKDSLVRFGELETFWAGKVFPFLLKPGASPGVALYFILATRDYCGLEILSGIQGPDQRSTYSSSLSPPPA